MSIGDNLNPFGQPVPILPVADALSPQQYYRQMQTFEIGWLAPYQDIGAVSRGTAVLFLRRKKPPFEPAVKSVFTDHLDACHLALKALGAEIIDEPKRKPWGLRQFTVSDPEGNLFHFHEWCGQSG